MLPRIMEIQLHWRNLIRLKNRFLNWEKSHTLEQNPDTVFLRDKDIECLFWKKTWFFYKIDEENKKVVIYAVVDGRQDYLNIIHGL